MGQPLPGWFLRLVCLGGSWEPDFVSRLGKGTLRCGLGYMAQFTLSQNPQNKAPTPSAILQPLSWPPAVSYPQSPGCCPRCPCVMWRLGSEKHWVTLLFRGISQDCSINHQEKNMCIKTLFLWGNWNPNILPIWWNPGGKRTLIPHEAWKRRISHWVNRDSEASVLAPSEKQEWSQCAETMKISYS